MNRYKEKMAIIKSRIKYLELWSHEEQDEKTKFAIYKVGQESIECITDLVAMICKDSNQDVKDDYSNISSLEKIDILDENQGNALREATGRRNRLVHDYNNLNDDLAMSSLLSLKPQIIDILEKLNIWILENSTN